MTPIGPNTDPERSLDVLTAIKCIGYPFLAFLPTEMTDFPARPCPYTLQLVKSLALFYIPEAWKRYPFRVEPPRIGHYREYPMGLV